MNEDRVNNGKAQMKLTENNVFISFKNLLNNFKENKRKGK
jgi:hypothetical protein